MIKVTETESNLLEGGSEDEDPYAYQESEESSQDVSSEIPNILFDSSKDKEESFG